MDPVEPTGLPGIGLLIRRFRVRIPRGALERPGQRASNAWFKGIGAPEVGLPYSWASSSCSTAEKWSIRPK